MKKNLISLFVALLCVVALASQAQAVTYTGSLSGGGPGIIATDGWNNSQTSFSWTVTSVGEVDGNILWKYDYAMVVPQKNISHFIVEVTPEATDFIFPDGTIASIGTWNGQGNSNPNIPEPVYGIKFDDNSTTDSLSGSFTTTRSPVWGDFYAKDGTDATSGVLVTAWNGGFTVSDPTAPAANGSLAYHILRPDGVTTAVPEPTTMLLLGLGLVGLAGVGRKFKK